MFFRNILANKNKIIPDYNFAAHLLLNNILSVNSKYRSDEVVVAVDDTSWRKQWYEDNKKEFSEYQYSAYKGNRKKDPELDWKKLFEILKNVEDVLRDYSDIRVIRSEGAEADDVIGVIAKLIVQRKNERVVIISSDKDFKQLLNDKVIMFDPIKYKEIKMTPEEATKYLTLLIIQGDKQDGIKAIGKRIGPKTAEKVYEKLDVYFYDNPEAKDRFEFNKKLIDFDCIPMNIEKGIISKFDEPQGDFNQMKLLEFCSKYRLIDVALKLNNLRNYEFSLI